MKVEAAGGDGRAQARASRGSSGGRAVSIIPRATPPRLVWRWQRLAPRSPPPLPH